MTPAQVAFSVALGTITVVISAFALYVISSALWSKRWYPRRGGAGGR